MSGAGRWIPGSLSGCAGLIVGLALMLILALVAVRAPSLNSAAPPQDWEITLEITNAYMGTLLREQSADLPLQLRDPKAQFSKDGTVLITGPLGTAPGLVPTPAIPLPSIPGLPPIPGVNSPLEIGAEVVLRPGSKDGKFTVEIIRTQLGPVPIPNGLGRLLEGPINAQIVNATQGRPFEITGVEVNEGYMLVRVRIQNR